ncbi:MAG: ankyrin repeat domain-containing protein [Spirochaetes bacterium]|nr:ankyrin repeat domain-containing protein [Spirochaetota bacterium]
MSAELFILSACVLCFFSHLNASSDEIKNIIREERTGEINSALISSWDDPEETPLIFAAKYSENSLRALISLKTDLNKKSIHGDTPLLAACKSEKWNCARILLSSGANPNIKDSSNKTPLFYASAKDIETVKLIVAKKGNVNSADFPALNAVENGKTDILVFLHKSGAKLYLIKNLIHTAAKSGTKDTLFYLASKKMNLNIKDQSGALPLHIAVENGRYDTAAFLLSRKSPVNAADYSGRTPLMRYLEKNNPPSAEYLNFLYKWKASFKIRNKNGESIIHTAPADKNLILFYKSKGAELNSRDKFGNTPLHAAVTAGDCARAEILISLGCEVNALNNVKVSPYDIALKSENCELSLLLLKHGARRSVSPENANQSILAKAVLNGNVERIKQLIPLIADDGIISDEVLRAAALQGDYAVFKIIFSHYLKASESDFEKKLYDSFLSNESFFSFAYSVKNYDPALVQMNRIFFTKAPVEVLSIFFRARGVNFSSANGITPLMTVSAYGNAERTKFILSKGGDLWKRDSAGFTPLTYSIINSNTETFDCLTQVRADVNRADYNRWSPLSHSVNCGNYEFTEKLINAGAVIDWAGYDGLTPLMIAYINRDSRIIALLEKAGARLRSEHNSIIKKNQLIKASYEGDSAFTEKLLSEIDEYDFKDKLGRTALIAACENSKISIVRILLEKKASVNVFAKNGETPLLISIKKSDTDIIRLLVQNGADINVYDSSGRTPLIAAVESGSEEDVSFLISNGADVNRKSSRGSAPVFSALTDSPKHLNMISLLSSKGADLNARDSYGRTALMLVCEQGFRRTAEVLIKNGADSKIKDYSGKNAMDYAVKKQNSSIVKLLLVPGENHSASAYALLGDQCVEESRYREAISYYSKAIKEDHTINVYVNMGVAFQNLRGYSIAQRCFSIALTRNPSDPVPYFKLACIKAGRRDNAGALDYLEKSFALGFKDFDKIDSDPRFTKLKKDPRFNALMEKYKTK